MKTERKLTLMLAAVAVLPKPEPKEEEQVKNLSGFQHERPVLRTLRQQEEEDLPVLHLEILPTPPRKMTPREKRLEKQAQDKAKQIVKRLSAQIGRNK